jgi:hypothetical protein
MTEITNTANKSINQNAIKYYVKINVSFFLTASRLYIDTKIGFAKGGKDYY